MLHVSGRVSLPGIANISVLQQPTWGRGLFPLPHPLPPPPPSPVQHGIRWLLLPPCQQYALFTLPHSCGLLPTHTRPPHPPQPPLHLASLHLSKAWGDGCRGWGYTLQHHSRRGPARVRLQCPCRWEQLLLPLPAQQCKVLIAAAPPLPS